MHLKKLEVVNFRNLVSQAVQFPKGVSLIIGKNGQGKTSLLEAIYLLAQGKSFRTSKSADFISWKKEGVVAGSDCQISAVLECQEGIKEIRYQLKNGKKTVYINSNKITEARLFYGQVVAIEFTPDDLELVKGPPVFRRQFLDRVLAETNRDYVENLVQYHRALKQRNAILSEFSRLSPKVEIAEKLLPWDIALIAHGALIAYRRFELLQEIQTAANRYHQILARDKKEIKLSYKSDFFEKGELLPKEKLSMLYQQSIEKDLRLQRTTIGIHRDDLSLFVTTQIDQQREARNLVSQGQARTLALSLKLAAAEFLQKKTGEPPIVLLDDVESELDSERKKALFELVSSLASQVLVTSSELTLGLKNTYQPSEILEISEGVIQPLK